MRFITFSRLGGPNANRSRSNAIHNRAINFAKKNQPYFTIGLVFLLVLAIVVVWPVGKHVKTARAPKDVVTRSTDKPSEQPIVKSSYKSTAGPTEPKYLSLPTIKTEGFVQKVGIDQNNQIAVPSNIYLAGWYVESLAPGQAGLSIIDGHLDGYQHDGIFIRLAKLKVGDKFDVTRGDNTVLHYTVRRVTTTETEKAADVLFSHDPKIKSQLNLITCGGVFNKSKKQYNQRVIVAAELNS